MRGKILPWFGKFVFWSYLIILVDLIVFKFPMSFIRMCFENWSPALVRAGIQSANFIPFRTIRLYIDYYDRLNSFENLFGNIIAFIPFGILYPLCHKLKKFYQVFLFSLILISGIEVFQLLTSLGAFDVDDFILNALGVCIGYFIYFISIKCIDTKKKKRRRKG